ncbi:MAG: UDP-N-acetylmuramoyl-L-alanyl-D-glutamate--2,6-diaminopimelate ligase [Candidatus Paceibacterota bacterium]|jgi:UDP-N-acetylmuramoyl-L-alanyl-D-glutamate--2,6-diaminopimelate ligase
MEISKLLVGVEIVNIIGDNTTSVFSINFNSRKTLDQSLFVAIKGTTKDGNQFIDEAIQKGAIAIVHETEHKNKKTGIVYIHVKNARSALAIMANNFYDNPSQKLRLVGVTGTNGKTTIATLLFNLFRQLGFHCALISTIENKIDDEIYETFQTTPDPVSIASLLASAVSKGCTYTFMECSSHAINQRRIDGLHFAGAIFTNLTHDHLDYHKTLDEYAKAKKQFFDRLPETAFALGNGDDERAQYLLRNTLAKKYFFSLKEKSDADFVGKIMAQSINGQTILINGKEVHTKLIGKYNASNFLGIFESAVLLGISVDKIIPLISSLSAPAGRLEFLKSNSGVYGVIDYAHTPDALQNVLETLIKIKTKNGKIITVVGCGGERDLTKREPMGSIACSLSDYVFFSSDNPRSEDPEHILQDIVKDLPQKNYQCIADREKAVAKACAMARPNDIVLLAGKGPEQYQIMDGYQIHYSDGEELRKNLKIDF